MADLETPTKSEVAPPPPPPAKNCFMADAGLRVLLFAATLASVVVMVTSNQTKLVPVPGIPILVPLPAKFTHSPAFIYFVAAVSVACFYSLITTLASISAVFRPASASTTKLFHFAVFDTIMLGLVASATGTAGGVAYIGLKGNSHVNWGKICDRFDKFCTHAGTSIALSLFASNLLLLLIFLSLFSLYKRIR